MPHVIVVFPGQGSQKPGMGKDLAEAFPEAKSVFEEIDDTLHFGLSRLCFDGPAEELTETRNAQPALFAHGAAVWRVLASTLDGNVDAAAGHSLGELTAYHAAGSLTVGSGATLVRRRGEIMFDVGTERPGIMAAILGSLSTPIDTLCEQASQEAGRVIAANYNTDQQTVVSGEVAGVERVMELAKAAGAKRALKLQVSGAFHSPLMEPAEAQFAEAIANAGFSDSAFPVYSNVTAAPVTDAATAQDVVLRQLTSPVRWVAEVQAMAEAYPEAVYVEMGPGNVLSGLISRIAKGATTIACGAPADIDKVVSLIETGVKS